MIFSFALHAEQELILKVRLVCSRWKYMTQLLRMRWTLERTELTSGHIIHLRRVFPHLVSLSLASCDEITPKAWSALSLLVHLETLIMPSNIIHESLQQLSSIASLTA